MSILRWITVMLVASILCGCGIYSFTGGQFGEAKSFSVGYLKPQTGLATPLYAQRLTESLKDVMLSQSPLKWTEENGDLQFSGMVTNYSTAPVAINSGSSETAALNRLSITIQIHYENTLEPALNFDKSFTKYADFNANQDLFTIEESLWKLINEQLTQEVYNASVGNW